VVKLEIEKIRNSAQPIEQLVMSRSNWFQALKVAFDQVVLKQKTVYRWELKSVSKLDYLDSIAQTLHLLPLVSKEDYLKEQGSHERVEKFLEFKKVISSLHQLKYE